MYGKNIATLAVGTAIGQAVAILASPVLTRLYSPDDFGALAVYTSIIGIAGSLASLSYHQAIPLPEEDIDAANVFALALFWVFLTVCFVVFAIASFGMELTSRLGVPELAPYLWMVPLGVLGLAFYEAVNQWANRKKSFFAVAQTSAAKGFVQTGTQLVLGFSTSGSFGLLLGQLLGQWVGAVSLIRTAIRESSAVFRHITIAGISSSATRYSKFLRFTSPSILFSVAGSSTPPIILSYFFGGAVAGLFALSERVLTIPVTLLAKNASQVFVASAADFHRKGRLSIEIEYLFERMLRLGLAPIIILGITSPTLFSVVFGDQWTEAGHYMRWLSALLLFVFITYALSPVIMVLERQKAGMWFQGLLAIGRIASLIIGGLLGDALLAVALYGIVGGLIWATYLGWLLFVSGVAMKHATSILIKTFSTSLAFIAPAAGCVVFGAYNVVTVGVVFVSVSLAVTWVLVHKNNYNA